MTIQQIIDKLNDMIARRVVTHDSFVNVLTNDDDLRDRSMYVIDDVIDDDNDAFCMIDRAQRHHNITSTTLQQRVINAIVREYNDSINNDARVIITHDDVRVVERIDVCACKRDNNDMTIFDIAMHDEHSRVIVIHYNDEILTMTQYYDVAFVTIDEKFYKQ
jgi:hypothetical protein